MAYSQAQLDERLGLLAYVFEYTGNQIRHPDYDDNILKEKIGSTLRYKPN